MIQEISLLAAFLAGALSITSPCVLPLIPIYLAHLAGVSIGESGIASRTRVMINAVAFVLGFSGIFVLLGVSFGALGGLLADQRIWLVRGGGILLVVMGLQLIGVIHIPFLEQQRQISVGERRGPVGRVASSFAIGAAFGAGWTPCVGPILGAILTLAAGTGSTGDAATLLALYAAGLGVPFLAAAAAFGSSPGIIRPRQSPPRPRQQRQWRRRPRHRRHPPPSAFMSNSSPSWPASPPGAHGNRMFNAESGEMVSAHNHLQPK